jgi:C4-dicarboxylate-specific signal transduction histidine kinase
MNMDPEGKDEKKPGIPFRHKYFFSISRKIWFSLGIMIIVYLVWMILGLFRGQETLSRLHIAQEQVFPAAMQSKVASAAFNEQVKLYKDAVVLGEAELLGKAKTMAAESQEALAHLVHLARFDEQKSTEVREILKQLRQFTAEAHSLYAKMASGIEDDSFPQKASQLNRRSMSLQERLTALTDFFSGSLKEELAAVSNVTRYQQYLNILIFFIAVSVMLIMVSLIISRWVTRPLKKAAALARAMSAGDLSRKLDIHQQDEIGELAHAMNVMAGEVAERTVSLEEANKKLRDEIAERKRTAEELKKAQEKLVETAWLVGKAEVATSVLHNVGNVLNSVNVTVNSLRNEYRYSKISNFFKAAGMIEEHRDNLAQFLTKDEKGVKLPVYLVALSKHLEKERETFTGMLEDLRNHVKHITGLIAIQQSHDTPAGLTEVVSVGELLEEALQVKTPGMSPSSVEIIRKFENIPPCRLDHHKFLQIVINLLSNASYAVKDSDNTSKIITVRLKKKGDDRFLVEIADNGIGIRGENLDKIFSLGFTTRKGGHGLGLHSAAIYAKKMGGSLKVHSGGPGKGAVFTLELPLQL